MISLEEALARILSFVDVLDAETRPILDCLGQVLAEDARSTIDVPPLDNSAMDGYAVLASDTVGAAQDKPHTVRVIGEVPAGHWTDDVVQPGTAIRIMTGAPVPRGADAVVQFEETDELARKARGEAIGMVAIYKAAELGQNIRRAGEDITRGQTVLAAGTVLRPAEIGVLASVGYATAQVFRRPRVAILATGDELVMPGQPLPPAKIYDSNTYTIAALVQKYGGIPTILGIARDRRDELVEKIGEGRKADLLLTSAGVSMGDYDIVKEVLAMEGEISFWTVRMKPGKPLAFGTLTATTDTGQTRRVPHLGLPGNPVSTMVAFEQFARPAILKMLGRTNFAKPTIKAVVAEPIENTDGRRVFARALISREKGTYVARLTGPQGSGILTSMALAQGLVVVPEDVARVEAGSVMDVQMLDWPEDVAVE